MQNIKPGQTITKKVTVKNTGTLDTAYNLVWQELSNTITNDEMVISATCKRLNSSNTEEGTCDEVTETLIKENVIKKKISIESGITHEYNVTITFKETNSAQNYNQGKSFSGILGIEEYINKVRTLKTKYFEESGMTDRGVVKSISFYSDNRVIDGAESYDVSEEKDGSVIMYVKSNSSNNSLYDLSIVANGIIYFPKDSSKLLSFVFNDPCSSVKSNLTTINFNNSIDTSRVVNMSNMFHYSMLTTLDLSGFDTRNVTDMSNMFYYSQLKTIDLSSFDTSNVTNMSNMFAYSKFTTLDLSNFNTSEVTNMSNMFEANETKYLYLKNFNTSNVTNMSYMFSNSRATDVDLSSFNTSNVTDMNQMFQSSAATMLNLSNFDTKRVTNMSEMFAGSKATSLNISSFDTSNVTNMYAMFSNNQATALDLRNFDTSNVTNMGSMFYVSHATTINLSSFDTSKVTNMSGMFSYSKATAIDLSNFNTSNVTNMSGMFYNIKATTLDVSNFDTSKVTSMNSMFRENSNLKTIYVSDKFSTNALNENYSSNYMFKDCTSLVGGQGTTYDSTKVDKTYARIDGGTSSPGYFTLKNN